MLTIRPVEKMQHLFLTIVVMFISTSAGAAEEAPRVSRTPQEAFDFEQKRSQQQALVELTHTDVQVRIQGAYKFDSFMYSDNNPNNPNNPQPLPQALPFLLKVMSDPDARVRNQGLNEVHKYPAQHIQELLPGVLKGVDDPDEVVRSQVTVLLCSWQDDPQALQGLLSSGESTSSGRLKKHCLIKSLRVNQMRQGLHSIALRFS